MPGLLEKRLIVVTGKGGVGKSTVATLLGLVAARAGKRTMVAELAAQDQVARHFDHHDPGFHEVELTPGLFTISIDPDHAMNEYLRLKAGRFADLLSSSRAFGYFAAATPGLRELLTLGKVWELAQLDRRTKGGARYDLVIVDAPATGHGAALLRTPKTFAEIARVGPIAHQGRTIHAFLADPTLTGVVAVALAEEMPVNETLALREELHRELGLGLDRIVVNALFPARFGPRQARTVDAALDQAGTPVARAALRAALAGHVRARRQRDHVARLAEDTGQTPVELPFVFAPALDRRALEDLSHELQVRL